MPHSHTEEAKCPSALRWLLWPKNPKLHCRETSLSPSLNTDQWCTEVILCSVMFVSPTLTLLSDGLRTTMTSGLAQGNLVDPSAGDLGRSFSLMEDRFGEQSSSDGQSHLCIQMVQILPFSNWSVMSLVGWSSVQNHNRHVFLKYL